MNSILKKLESSNEIILGKEESLKLALICFFSGGHLLIEDVPGVGKTTFAKYIAKVLGLNFSRIQFTSDLMPADILGVQIYNQQKNSIEFFPGPLFADCILADELNRGNPRTQSSLLEAMAENQITIDRKTYELSKNFFVIATQNPREQIGTNPLPESQLDRFMMKISLGFPDKSIETQILMHDDRTQKLKNLSPLLSIDEIQKLKCEIENIKVSPALINYVTTLLNVSRNDPRFMGLSPRVGIDLIKGAKVAAYFHGHSSVLPDHIQEVLKPIVGHRLSYDKLLNNDQELKLAEKLIQAVSVL